MRHSAAFSRLLAVAGLGLLAACADQSTAPVASNAAPAVQPLVAGEPLGQFWQKDGLVLARKPARGGRVNLLVYHNGPVLKTNKSMAILWGPQWTSGSFPSDVVSGLDQLFGGWNQSNFAKLNDEYYDTNGQITANHTYLGHVFDGTAAPSGALSVNQAVSEACKVTGNNPDPLALYLIYTPTFPSGTNYCAWHSWGSCSNGAQIQVAYEPNPAGVSGCDPQDTWTSHSQMLASLANTSAHELAEAITDPRGSAWYDRQGNENADKCAWQFSAPVKLSNGTSWKIQMNWSNASKGCLQGS
ncbi:MAG TPA: hypothetical protein VNH46_08180 [Gemmatimonadales bacterium]|nr:hypothetical protein [Gemmatimonadales bacterium]